MRRPGERVGSSQDIELIAEDLELFADGMSCSRCSGRNRAAPADPGRIWAASAALERQENLSCLRSSWSKFVMHAAEAQQDVLSWGATVMFATG